jgi:hypothetical protein
MAKAGGQVKFLGAKMGEYNQEIYGGFLGLSADEIADLEDKKVI